MVPETSQTMKLNLGCLLFCTVSVALADAQRDLLSRADRLRDPAQRQRYLTAVAQHREIMAAAARP